MADFDDVVVKPYRINEMLDQIERAVREGPTAREPRNGKMKDGNGNGIGNANVHEQRESDSEREEVRSPDALLFEARRRSSVWGEI